MRKGDRNRAISLQAACPVCFSPEGEPCTAPTDKSRREVTWFHISRFEAGSKIDGATETSPQKP